MVRFVFIILITSFSCFAQTDEANAPSLSPLQLKKNNSNVYEMLFDSTGRALNKIKQLSTGRILTITGLTFSFDTSEFGRRYEINNFTKNISFGAKVGIGTTEPTSNLHILSATHPTLRLGDLSNAESNTNAKLGEIIFGNHYDVLSTTSIYAWSNFATTAYYTDLRFDVGNYPCMTIRSSSNVGIGTTAPNAKLQITGGDAYIETQSNGVILRATDGSNCYRLTVNNAGTITTTLVTCP